VSELTNQPFLEPPDLSGLLDAKAKEIIKRMNCIQVGTISSFDATTQLAKVSINFKRRRKGAQYVAPGQTSDIIDDYNAMVQVPVFVLNGGGAYLSLPVASGDTCILLFNDVDIDGWLNSNQTLPPNSDRVHDLSDAIALVGIHSKLNPIANFNTLIASLIDKTGERLAQAGDLKATARTSASPGWVLCYGQAISRTTYDVLFAAIGTTYGAGDGSSTFNVPDFRGRTPVGLDNMGGTNADVLTNTFAPNRNTLGGAVGEEAHQLTIPEMPSHTHTLNANGTDLTGGQTSNVRTNSAYEHTATTSSAGGDQSHNNVQPGRMVNWEIKL
jgi:microcystin-dependent protein